MAKWTYSDKVKDHFMNPRNILREDNEAEYHGIGLTGNIKCGDEMMVYIKVDPATLTITDCKWRTYGCASAIASSSVLTDLIRGKTLEEALKVTNKDIAEELGGLPEQKMHCSVMGREALEAAIENYRSGGTRKHELEGHVVCTCFGVTDKEIERVVEENDLATVEEVTNYCKAGGGCGGCHGEIERIIQRVQGARTARPHGAPAKRPAKLTNIQKIRLIEQTIDEQVRPALRAHGGNIELVDVVGDKVIVAFRGMCAQCRLTEFTMKDVVEAKLREFVSEELYVEEDADSAGEPHAHRE